MPYFFLALGILFVIAFTIYVSLTGNRHRWRNENMKEENAHRDFAENNGRSGQHNFKHRLK